jgi:hypothetical protein
LTKCHLPILPIKLFRKELTAEDRAHWDAVAAKDKERYLEEKASYTGPWQVPHKRQRKDPSAPKRPMSAFLYYSQHRRRAVRDEHPEMKNTEVSRYLGELWRNASEEEKKPYIDREIAEREKYKVAMATWRKEDDIRKEQRRKQEEEHAARWKDQEPGPHEQETMEYPATHGDPHVHYSAPPPPHYMPPTYGYPPYSYPRKFTTKMVTYFILLSDLRADISFLFLKLSEQYGHHPPGPFPGYPTNGKPVILGANGMPIYPPPSSPYRHRGPPPPIGYHPPPRPEERDPHASSYDYPQAEAAG